jgi:DNA mismatch repair ATPase MutS
VGPSNLPFSNASLMQVQSYFDQAAEVSRLLNIKLTHRTWDKRRILMCGFPLPHLDKFLKILVHENNRFVALCEEFPRSPFVNKDGFDRRVARIITPGTLIDESFLNPYEDNYLLAIGFSPKSLRDNGTAEEQTNSIGLAWIDISTGEFFTNSCTFESLRDEITRIGPREIVLDKDLNVDAHPLRQVLLDEGSFVSYIKPSDVAIPTASPVAGSDYDELASPYEPSPPLPSFAFTSEETIAVKLLTTFLHANLLDHMPKLASPRKQPADGRMHIDSHTLKSLEIRESMTEGGTKGSMLSVVKRTVTSSGTRLLARWLCKYFSVFLKELVLIVVTRFPEYVNSRNHGSPITGVLFSRETSPSRRPF